MGSKPIAFLSIIGMLASGMSSVAAQEFTDVNADFTGLGESFIRNGVFLPLQEISKVEQGGSRLSKRDVASFLGNPNDSASAFQDSNWLYNINLPLAGDDYLVCQYRVTFSQELVTNSEWRRPQCETRYLELSEPQEYTLSADLLFGFDSAAISPDGLLAIQQIAGEIQQYFDTPSITVLGYTDRIGAANYNMQLSERRAESVATALINSGINPGWIVYEGRGQNEAIADCSGTTGEELKSCLAPNRRVYISLNEQF